MRGRKAISRANANCAGIVQLTTTRANLNVNSRSLIVSAGFNGFCQAYLPPFSYVANIDEIKGHEFNLNIPRYVDTFEEEEIIDIDEVRNNIKNIKSELVEVEAQLERYLEELGLGV